jgi:iron complex transport system substrate-binding protein
MMRWLLLLIAPLLSHAAVERLVTLGGDVTEIVYALGAQQSLVAGTAPAAGPRRRKNCRMSATCGS